jgi:hypothetical protein
MAPVVALSDTTTSLIAALLGAIVGGVATLAGSIVVNRRERALDARLRMYDKLLPATGKAWETFTSESEAGPLNESLYALRRASVIAGPAERRIVDTIFQRWARASELERQADTVMSEFNERRRKYEQRLAERRASAGAQENLKDQESDLNKPYPQALLNEANTLKRDAQELRGSTAELLNKLSRTLERHLD